MEDLSALITSKDRIGRWCYGIIPDPELCIECRQCELYRKLQENPFIILSEGDNPWNSR